MWNFLKVVAFVVGFVSVRFGLSWFAVSLSDDFVLPAETVEVVEVAVDTRDLVALNDAVMAASSAAARATENASEMNTLCSALESSTGPMYAGWEAVCFEIGSRAHDYGVDPTTALAVAWHESRLYMDAVGAVGEVGPLQVRPEMHCGGSCEDLIGAGLTVLARYLSRYDEERAALCRYKGAGPRCDSGAERLATANRIRSSYAMARLGDSSLAFRIGQ